ncbi:MAG: YHYH protein, partial [Acidobacteriota bacterium]
MQDFRPARQPQRPSSHTRPVSSSISMPPEPPRDDFDDDDDEHAHNVFAAKTAFVFIFIIFFLGAGGLVSWLYISNKDKSPRSVQASQTSEQKEIESAEGLQLNPNKNYGEKYADGILPVGDKKFVTDGPKKGYVYLCEPNFKTADNSTNNVRGPWFVGNSEWNANKKPKVSGNASLASRFNDKIANGIRTIYTNALPSHPTGTFPVNMLDPTNMFDRNPYSIGAHELSLNLPAKPEYSAPQCIGPEVGVLITGSLLVNSFDEAGRDAAAWEVHDACGGHPSKAGFYHYHTLSPCLSNVTVSTVIGYALDGFPITGSIVGKNNYLTTNDLDECHGIISDV